VLLAPGTDVRAEPRELGGILYEEVVRGATVEGEPLPVLVAFHYAGGTARESFDHNDQVAGPVRILAPPGAWPRCRTGSLIPVRRGRPDANQSAFPRSTEGSCPSKSISGSIRDDHQDPARHGVARHQRSRSSRDAGEG
jgi:hypothetical protein